MLAKWAGASATLAMAMPAFADEVVLRNGAVFAGVVREEGDKIVVEVDFGAVTFRRTEVREVRRTDDPLKEFDRRLKAVADVPEYYDLGLWARERGLTTRANDLFQKAISLEPDHEGARRALGYERFEGKWLAGDELMVARGFVRHEGRWLKRETVERILEQENQVRLEVERQAAAERIARMGREIEMARLAVEREKIEAEKQRMYFHWVRWIPVACWRRQVPGAHPNKHPKHEDKGKPGDEHPDRVDPRNPGAR